MYTIEKNIPIKEQRGELPNAIRSLDVGDSFVVENNRRSYAYVCASMAKIKIKASKEGNAIRVWRIA